MDFTLQVGLGEMVLDHKDIAPTLLAILPLSNKPLEMLKVKSEVKTSRVFSHFFSYFAVCTGLGGFRRVSST